MRHKILRPQQFNKRNFLRIKRPITPMHYRIIPRKGFTDSYPVNVKTMGAIFSKLHYLAEHAPLPIQIKWKSAARRFEKHHVGDWTRYTMRFSYKLSSNKYM